MPPDGLMQMIMQDMMKTMSSGGLPMPPGGGTIRISSPMGGGMMTMRRTIVQPAHHDDKDDDDDHIPPEILELIKMTESMHARPSFFGPPMIRIGGGSIKKEEKIERKDESSEQIMARMNKLSQEIGEKNELRKYEFADKKGQRICYFLLS